MGLLKITDDAIERNKESLTVIEPNAYFKELNVIPDDSSKTNIDTALAVLFAYIPTEIITLYIAFISTVDSTVSRTNWITFGIFLFFTPIVVWLVYAAKYKKDNNNKLPISYRSLPLWEMFASSISFIAWAFALPMSVFNNFDWYSQSVAGLGILITSTVLGLAAPFFNKV